MCERLTEAVVEVTEARTKTQMAVGEENGGIDGDIRGDIDGDIGDVVGGRSLRTAAVRDAVPVSSDSAGVKSRAVEEVVEGEDCSSRLDWLSVSEVSS